MMDAVDDKVIERIEEKAYNAVMSLFRRPIRVIFYDATTVYFESFKEDEIRQKGYSKDMKFNQTQVLLAVMVTDKGIPIGYQLYEGSKYEGKTLKDAIEKIQQRYNIEEITFVADSAILSRANIEILESLGKKYIIGARIRNMTKDIKEQIINIESYESINSSDGERYLVKEIPIGGGQRLIVTYSEDRARKDARDREETIERLMKRLQSKEAKAESLISNYGYKKYIKIKGGNEVEIDQDKIEEAKKWDGLHGVITNDKELAVEEIISQYKGLWQVEETFRISKHDIKIRPIYHWTPRRIKAHIAICFMALCCARHLGYRIAIEKGAMSTERIRQALNSVQLSILEDIGSKNLYGIPSVIKQDAKIIYDAMGLRHSSVPFQIK
jgi:transposase